jgi:hypothetical protein
VACVVYVIKSVGQAALRRLAAGTYSQSVETGKPIPDERLEGLPTAERTVEGHAHAYTSFGVSSASRTSPSGAVAFPSSQPSLAIVTGSV